MAEVKRIPQWVMLEALRNNVTGMQLEKSDGTFTGAVGVGPTDFYISTQDYEPVLKLSIPETLEVGVGDTITDISLFIDGTNAPTVYDNSEDHKIRFPIGGVDGETFPDGGSIEVTDFEVYLNDL